MEGSAGVVNNCAGNSIGAWHCRPHYTILKLEGKLSSHRKLRLMVIHLSRYHRGLRTYLIPYASAAITQKDKSNKSSSIKRMCEVLRKEEVMQLFQNLYIDIMDITKHLQKC